MDTVLLIQYKENSETAMMLQIEKQIYWYSFMMGHVFFCAYFCY